MFFIILSVIFIVIGTVFTVLWRVAENKPHWTCEEIFCGLMCGGWACSLVVVLLTVIMLPVEYCSDKQFVETFERQKYYIEEVAPTLPETDNYAITQSRIELNQQLYDLQYSCEHYSFFFFYPKEIKELEPIQ